MTKKLRFSNFLLGSQMSNAKTGVLVLIDGHATVP